ncbi:MAG: DUF4832 domain-containing protein [Deltaproteobacteria bacterium]|nr:DUF4832 domain-containing protein [Deltaproteobacteria bacterium]
MDQTVDQTVDPTYKNIPLKSTITAVQPMTGIVLWEDAWNSDSVKTSPGNIQLEYAYVKPSDIVSQRDTYNWSSFENFLNRIAGRSHQAVVRFYYVYPGETTAVPQYIKDLPDYNETSGTSEGQKTSFPDWTHAELMRAHLAFYTAFALRYDNDPRVAFLQTGFGLWGEYHIYDGPNAIGEQFPSKAFQETFLQHLAAELKTTHWSISIDAGDSYYSPFSAKPPLLGLEFGNFDDSFMHEQHSDYNASMWDFFGHLQRYEHSPHGGELSYYSTYDQEHALDAQGIYGRTYEQLSAKFHISYMIGNDQPLYQSDARIRAAGMANGYRFEVISFRASSNHSWVHVRNVGIAPIYYDAFVAVNGIRAGESLKGLLPGATREYSIPAGGATPTLNVECDRLVAGQKIDLHADL